MGEYAEGDLRSGAPDITAVSCAMNLKSRSSKAAV